MSTKSILTIGDIASVLYGVESAVNLLASRVASKGFEDDVEDDKRYYWTDDEKAMFEQAVCSLMEAQHIFDNPDNLISIK